MVKLVLQITAKVLNCMVSPQRDNEHLDTFKVTMVMLLLQNTADVNMMKLALNMTTEMNV